jgi:hypothetical protein
MSLAVSFCLSYSTDSVFPQTVIPETKGVSLESMDALFGVVPHDHDALVQGRLGAAVNLHKVENDTQSTDNKTAAKSHVEQV